MFKKVNRKIKLCELIRFEYIYIYVSVKCFYLFIVYISNTCKRIKIYTNCIIL